MHDQSLSLLPPKALIALSVALYVAHHASRHAPLRSDKIAAYFALKPRALEPILQQLVRAEVLYSTHGQQGGYHIPHPERVSVWQVVAGYMQSPAPASFGLWQSFMTQELAQAYDAWRAQLKQQSLSSLAHRAVRAKIMPQASGFMDFSI